MGGPEDERRGAIEWTKSAFLLLTLGSIVDWVPVIGLAGTLLIVLGIVIVLSARHAFGPDHEANVLLSVVLLSAVILLRVQNFLFDPTGFFLPIVMEVLRGLALVLLAHALLPLMGRVLLWGALGATVVVWYEVWFWWLRSRIIPPVWSEVFWALPSALFAGAYYLVWFRIHRGEIPEARAGISGSSS